MNDNGETMPTPADEVRPIPPRYWWLKRLALATLVLLLILIAVRIWWGWYAERRLEALIAEYHAAGQPVLLEDYAEEPVPDDENAAKCYQEAHTAFVRSLPQSIDLGDGTQIALDIEDLLSSSDIVATHLDDLDALLKANAKPLELVREARSRP
ncbi:MAG: hypothetical protein ABIG44_02570, partial [Planctomycetota bacterium]